MGKEAPSCGVDDDVRPGMNAEVQVKKRKGKKRKKEKKKRKHSIEGNSIDCEVSALCDNVERKRSKLLHHNDEGTNSRLHSHENPKSQIDSSYDETEREKSALHVVNDTSESISSNIIRNDNMHDPKKVKKDKKQKKDKTKKKKKRHRDDFGATASQPEADSISQSVPSSSTVDVHINKINSIGKDPATRPTKLVTQESNEQLGFPCRYIVAPMVGASELPFRLLCRRYGAQCAYTPMMSATQFGLDDEYRKREFQTTPDDRPLVCHFAANDPADFARAAKMAEPYCDAIDLNLGCPQRTAYVGHFGSYLLTPKDRSLILDIVRAGVSAVSIPIFVKIRLLDTVDETLELCRQLSSAGASLIAIHARYRATFDRKGPGARDGPAMLDQVAQIREALATENGNNSDGKKARPSSRKVLIVTNGNTITYDDVVANLESTKADGIMSAEGILDNPALFLGRWGSREESTKLVKIWNPPVPVSPQQQNKKASQVGSVSENVEVSTDVSKKKRKLLKKIREIERIEEKVSKDGLSSLTNDQRGKLSSKPSVQKQLEKLGDSNTIQVSSSNGRTVEFNTDSNKLSEDISTHKTSESDTPGLSITSDSMKETTLGALYESSDDKVALALEYIQLVRQYPVAIRSVIFHTRRMAKAELTTYQLMDDCIKCTSVDEVATILHKIQSYQSNPDTFTFDVQKAKMEREALERKRQEEGKRKAYEARMIRKAKREGKTGMDLEYYLRQGAAVPTLETISKLKKMPSREDQMKLWKDQDHSQHCLVYHLSGGNCPRGRACAFLHVDPQSKTSFVEQDEVAG